MLKTMSEVNLSDMELKIKSLVLNKCQMSGLEVKASVDASGVLVVSINLSDDETSHQYDPFETPKQISDHWIALHSEGQS